RPTRVCSGRGGRRIPTDRVRGRRVFRAQGRSIELELDADDAHVVRSVGGNRDGAGDRRARSRRGHAHRRRRRVGYGDGHRSGAGVVGRITGDRSQGVGAGGGGGGVPTDGVGGRGVVHAPGRPV